MGLHGALPIMGPWPVCWLAKAIGWLYGAYIYIPSGYVRKLLKMAIDIVDLLYLFNMMFFQQERCGTMRVFNHHNMIKHWGPAHPVPTAVVPRRVNMGWARLENIPHSYG